MIGLNTLLEGVAFGPDVTMNGATRHTLSVANDNDFSATVDDVDNPNKFIVFAFDDSDLPGLAAQRFTRGDNEDEGH
jgi:hypothetical protein